MEPISGITPGAIHSPETINGIAHMNKAQESPSVQQTQKDAPSYPQNKARDEYVPEERQDPSGRYWPDRDEEGNPKIHFDKSEENPSGKKAETCTGNTDKVDREIKKLKKEKEELEQKINSEQDETKLRELEKKLEQVEQELRQKDNDTYRRQHAEFS